MSPKINNKVFRDPVHGLITFDKDKEKVFLELIDAPEFQRLKRVRQLGLSYVAFPGAVHSRFEHSLGVCHLAGKYIDRLHELYGDEKNIFGNDAEYEEHRKIVRVAALLHDIGHGPFSHVFEMSMNEISGAKTEKHEQWTQKIIMDNASSIRQILIANKIDPQALIKIIDR